MEEKSASTGRHGKRWEGAEGKAGSQHGVGRELGMTGKDGNAMRFSRIPTFIVPASVDGDVAVDDLKRRTSRLQVKLLELPIYSR